MWNFYYKNKVTGGILDSHLISLRLAMAAIRPELNLLLAVFTVRQAFHDVHCWHLDNLRYTLTLLTSLGWVVFVW